MNDIGGSLREIIEQIDSHFEKGHPSYFREPFTHPVLALKKSKILHDNLWGTNRFTWQELAIIDSPFFQRLRYIHQVGLAFQVYMSAHHTRFEHSLGVVTIASRIFDKVLERNENDIHNILRSVYGTEIDEREIILKLRQELRLAALLHDTGHSLFSHTSERVYGRLELLKAAAKELSDLVGKEKGAGEVLSFCIAQTNAVKNLIRNAENKLLEEIKPRKFSSDIDFLNIALLIVGRAKHPFLQFLGDIVSSGFDADKLDYLVRDAANAGLPLQYDFERYLYSVRLEKDALVDGESSLENLYEICNEPDSQPKRTKATAKVRHPYYETYRLKIPDKALSTIEQIIICKLMLFSYIYHHPKVRSAEGLLEKMLDMIVKKWKEEGLSEKDILDKFLDYTDSTLQGDLRVDADKAGMRDYHYRIVNRLLPREIFSMSGASGSHAENALLIDFLTDFQDRDKKKEKIEEFEECIGRKLLEKDHLFANDTKEALQKAGVWVDVPPPPKFEDVNETVLRRRDGESNGTALTRVFPIEEWTEGYIHYRYQIRIFGFSEFLTEIQNASVEAMKEKIGISGDGFYKNIKKNRNAFS